jgi:site-specific recombinase XerD
MPMGQAPTDAHPTPTLGDLATNVASFRRHLRAENVSPNTVLAYVGAVEQLADYLVAQGMPTDVARIKREHVEAFIAYLLDETKPDGSKRWKPATANNRFRGCQRFFNWLVEEGEIRSSPMARMKPPRIPEQPPEVIREDDPKKLLATCAKDTRAAANASSVPGDGPRWPSIATCGTAPSTARSTRHGSGSGGGAA